MHYSVKDITYRLAIPEDCNLFFDWANEFEVRKNAINSDSIAYDQHISWFNKKLKSDSLLFVFFLQNVPFGQVRIDIEERSGIIDYSIISAQRGKGLGTEMILQVLKIITKTKAVKNVIAIVKSSNAPSCKVFTKAGFKLSDIKKIKEDIYQEYQFQITSENVSEK